MWLADRRGILAGLAVGAALLTGACQVRPLYGPTPGGTALSAELQAITVAPAAGRIGQIVRNELLFLLNGGSQEGALYELRVQAEATASDVNVRLVGGEPQGRLLNVRATFALYRRGESEAIFSGAATRQATYEWTNQRFSNERAEIDARARAAKEAAEEIRMRLAAYFATGGQAASETSPALPETTDEEGRRGLRGGIGSLTGS